MLQKNHNVPHQLNLYALFLPILWVNVFGQSNLILGYNLLTLALLMALGSPILYWLNRDGSLLSVNFTYTRTGKVYWRADLQIWVICSYVLLGVGNLITIIPKISF